MEILHTAGNGQVTLCHKTYDELNDEEKKLLQDTYQYRLKEIREEYANYQVRYKKTGKLIGIRPKSFTKEYEQLLDDSHFDLLDALALTTKGASRKDRQAAQKHYDLQLEVEERKQKEAEKKAKSINVSEKGNLVNFTLNGKAEFLVWNGKEKIAVAGNVEKNVSGINADNYEHTNMYLINLVTEKLKAAGFTIYSDKDFLNGDKAELEKIKQSVIA